MKYRNAQAAKAAKEKAIAHGRKITTDAKAAGRDVTPAEETQVRALIDEARDAHEQEKALEGDAELLADLTRMGTPVGPGGFGTRSAPIRGDGQWAKGMTDFLGRVGAKELVPSGAITVPSLSGGITTATDRPRSILNLIPFAPLDGGDSFAYLRETVRTHAASTVRPGQAKPHSTYSLEKIEDHVRVIAHLSEPIDRSLLLDVALLQQYLEGALRDGVLLHLEDQVLNGDGSTTGVTDHLEGILETSGIQVQTFASDRLLTARKAVTLLERQNLDPAGFAFAMSPDEWETYETTTSTEHFVLGDPGTPGASVPVDRARRQLFGYPVVTTTALDDGPAIFGDFRGSAVVREREGVRIEWSDSVTVDGVSGFQSNRYSFRAEGRWGLAVTRPAGFVEVQLVEGS